MLAPVPAQRRPIFFWISLAANALLLAVVLALWATNPSLSHSQQPSSETSAIEAYPYLSKRIFAESQNDILINFIPLRQALREYAEKTENKVGVYFEYLPSGTSIGANEKGEVKLVSLSKVPLVMAIYKKIERGKMSKDDRFTIKKEHLNQYFGNLWKRGEGVSLSVEELVKLTLVDSDNTAYNVLSDELTEQEAGEVYEGLDIQLTIEDEYLLVSPKNYSSIFRSLYLSSFLTKEHSSHILDILTQTPFRDQIDAGVPDTIKIAHKIGVFKQVGDAQEVYIDCGIVYVPNRPYVLCVFVQDTLEQAQRHTSLISRMVYEYIRIAKAE
jgi:beta-lactamase class A